MVIDIINNLTKKWEDPRNPLLGPLLKALSLFGLWKRENKIQFYCYAFIHVASLIFVFQLFIDVYCVRHDLNEVLNNISLTVLSVICLSKIFCMVMWQSDWRKLVQEISDEENHQINKQDPVILTNMNQYTIYTRVVTIVFWVLVIVTELLLIITPLLKYISSEKYREQIDTGEERIPQIVNTWFPFDLNHTPAYIIALVYETMHTCLGAGIIATYDMNAVAIMTYFKGQLKILRHSCINLFHEATTVDHVLRKIEECHRHHNVLLKQYKMFNALLSPIMCLYVLLCSMTICGSVVQFTLENVTFAQKLFVIQYTMGLVFQLFMFCWHANEVTFESLKVDEGVYNSDWWKADKHLLKQLLLLAGKLNAPFILNAGPCATLGLAAFIEIIKGSYSFYTLLTKMKEN